MGDQNSASSKDWRKQLTPEEEAAIRQSGQSLSDLAAASAPGDRKPGEDLRERQEKLVDEAVEETFPASDPISPKRITK
ncbi:hypothetical protein [Enterovirga sp. CN4-39]|uniref:hypothetical protein n=1 Tax=Enterovirga sp. CN4-39 TaxID=3400910 RepID=UPI003BFE4F96